MRTPKRPPNVPDIVAEEKNRNEIAEYLARVDVRSVIQKANEEYLHWEEFKKRPLPHGTKPELVWSLMKILREANAKRLKFSDVPNFIFQFSMTDQIMQQLHLFDLNIGGALGTESVIPEDKDTYLISSLMEEAIASSQLEGAATTRKIAKDMLRKSRKPRNTGEKMILNNYNTIKKIIELKEESLTPKLLLNIQECVTKGTLKDRNYEGSFRKTNDVHVVDQQTGEIVHIPPDCNHVPGLIDKFCNFANDTGYMHPIIKASILHFLIGYIHPFTDGNGRTARAIFYWYLIKKKYWLIEYMSISRTILKSPTQYGRAYLYTETDSNDLTYFIAYQLKTLDIAFADLKSYIEKKLKEKKKMYPLLQAGGLNPRQAQILMEFENDPKKMMTIKEAQTGFDVVYQTARLDILDLEKKGFLKKKLRGKRNIAFFRTDDFESRIKKYKEKS